MMRLHLATGIAFAALAAVSGAAFAQDVTQAFSRCGPGASYGVVGYRAAQLGVSRHPDSTRATYIFGAEPVVVGVDSTSRVRPGDVIIALNRHPITTRAGADLFAYPNGDVVLTVRRNGATVDLSYSFRPGPCWEEFGNTRYALSAPNRVSTADHAFVDSVRGRLSTVIAGGRGGRGGGGRGGVAGTVTATDTALSRLLPLITPRVATASFGTVTSSIAVTNFGFGLLCRPGCERARAGDSASYWRFTAYPAVARMSVPEDGVAGKAGIREGDILISVNGHSPLSEEGALLLERAGALLSLSLEFSRGGSRRTYTLRL